MPDAVWMTALAVASLATLMAYTLVSWIIGRRLAMALFVTGLVAYLVMLWT